MPITHHQEDILPHIPTTQGTAPNITVHEGKLVSEALSGCVTLMDPIQVCYSLNLNPASAKISLKVGGVSIITGEISSEHPCLHFSGDYGFAKWDIQLCLNLQELSITLNGKACFHDFCKQVDITLVKW